MIRKAFKAKVGIILGITGLLVAFQNCGKGAFTANDEIKSVGNPDIINAERASISTEEQALLKSVLANYADCSRIGSTDQANKCMRSALETSASTNQKILGDSIAEPTICYVVGPACAGSEINTINPEDAMKLQYCRADAAKTGMSFETLNQLMGNDPIGYAELLNAKCLYPNHKCVVAVRCILREKTTISAGLN